MKVSGLDYRFSPPHQKRGDASPRFVSPMRSGPARRIPPHVRLSRTLSRVGTLLVLLAVAGLLIAIPARAAYGGADSEEYSWSNGPVQCVFNGTLPTVTVSATALVDNGLGAGLVAVNEMSSAGTPVATALMNSTVWDPEDQSSSSWYKMNYTEQVNVTNAATPGKTLGTSSIAITFSLARPPGNSSVSDQVAFQVSIDQWPWQSPHDTLALVVPMWSAFSTAEHVVVPSSTTSRIDNVQNSTGTSVEYFAAGSSATTGSGVVVGVTPQTTLTDGIATTTLTFGPGAGNASALTYEATLGITLNTRVLGLPLYDYVAVAGGAGLVALVVGVGTRTIRRHPSDLTYVEEPQ
jgi:hypothetical protein